MSSDALAVRWPEQGVRLRNGQLRAQLTGDRLVLQRHRKAIPAMPRPTARSASARATRPCS
ncbi:hypothetical protein [Massilia sp. Dwa41.01b]|uniref:hypothetical protein n=1 Tax=Massilia sp. Dwa41.01b TaxID=2709302 RepID=UPI001E3CFF30|nr:hypothetical protein [Massilia sp. Dwa41.01b]